MADFPYMPMFWDAYIQDTDHLTYEQHGLYLNLLRHMWCAPGQRVPNDDAWLARRFRMSETDVVAKLRPLVKEFCKTTKHFITQERLTREFLRSKERSEKQRKRSKSRWEKGNEASHGKADDAEQEKCAPANPTTTTTTESTIVDSSVPIGTAADAAQVAELQPPAADARAVLWREIKAEIGGKNPGAVMGQWCRDYGEGAVVEAHFASKLKPPADYVSWMKGTLNGKAKAMVPARDFRLISGDPRSSIPG